MIATAAGDRGSESGGAVNAGGNVGTGEHDRSLLLAAMR